MGASSSIEKDEPIRAGPNYEPSPPDEEERRALRAALKNTNHKRGESRKLKAAALGMHCSSSVDAVSAWTT